MIVTLLAAALSLAGSHLSAQNLKDEARLFPADIAEKRAVIVLTFSKSASDQATEWTRKLRQNERKLAASIYQIAILEDVPALFRSLVISGIKKGVPQDLHHNFWIGTSSSKEWQEKTGSTSLNEAQVFVLEAQSQITWRFQGAFSESALQGLFMVLATRPNL
ncbi:MAG TPA: hypothetical protein VJ719_15245 [Chthoniobacterales bacterium]|nr:hypothetical protein [Chthoniobacterales bacterium]